MLTYSMLLFGLIKASYEHSKPIEDTSSYLPTYISFSLILFEKILLFPTAYTAINLYTCSHCTSCLTLALSCQSATHIVLATLATLTYLLAVVVALFSAWLFADESPDSRLPWALRNRRVALLGKFRLLFAATLVSRSSGKEYFCICLLIVVLCDFLSLYLHIICPSYLNKVVQTLDILTRVFTGIYGIYVLVLIVLRANKNRSSTLLLTYTTLCSLASGSPYS
eukprot:TRINITY_DN10619_c0_g3_i2.p1 TRINITY_DN10619_c0_g3~~TRINITY_DN10619_c0_g3_i2.p1  ORF type:complete len:224 (+),score=14.45 TRINITY_DN10619_c0_g3_i2:506-1177(+)